MKKITLVLATLGLSTVALAGAPGNNMVVPTGTPVIAPDSTGMWSFGLEGMYVENNSGYNYATSADSTNELVTNGWDWGGTAYLSYMFPGSSRDISASYTYLNFTDDDTAPSLIGGNTVKGHNDTTLNGATLTFGQMLTVGDHLSLHPFAGLQFADIDNNDKRSGYDATGNVENNRVDYDTDFTGVGPRAGLDMTYHFTPNGGFSIVGTMAGSLLVGNMDADTSAYTFDAAGVATQVSSASQDSYTAIVPELDARLGVDYMYAFNPTTSMNVQAGYQVVNYFNAESSSLSSASTDDGDFGYNGPYLKLQLNVA